MSCESLVPMAFRGSNAVLSVATNSTLRMDKRGREEKDHFRHNSSQEDMEFNSISIAFHRL